jgi:hypothetical protein
VCLKKEARKKNMNWEGMGEKRRKRERGKPNEK